MRNCNYENPYQTGHFVNISMHSKVPTNFIKPHLLAENWAYAELHQVELTDLERSVSLLSTYMYSEFDKVKYILNKT